MILVTGINVIADAKDHMAQGVGQSLHGKRDVNSGVPELTQQANNKH